MKRGIRDMKKPVQPQADVRAEDLFRQYSGKSESELMDALRKMQPEDLKQLGALQQELSPMLTEAQREKLESIIRSLTS